MKAIIAVLLILAFGICAENLTAPDKKEVSAETATIDIDTTYIVYYFTGNARCATCHKLEKYTRESIEENYAEEIESGKIEFALVNFDEPKNNHFIEDYALYTKSVIISKRYSDEEIAWKNLDKIWKLVRNKEQYLAYIRDEVSDFMEPGDN